MVVLKSIFISCVYFDTGISSIETRQILKETVLRETIEKEFLLRYIDSKFEELKLHVDKRIDEKFELFKNN
jgi:disulfide oxidoreductase YuzD